MRFLAHALFALLAGSAAAQTQWHVSPSGDDANSGTSPTAPFRTILRAAQAAAAGDIVRIGPGIYGNEQGAITLGDKELTLVGAGIGQTVLVAHSSLDQQLPTGVPGPGTSLAPHRVILNIQGNARVDLRDLTLDSAFRIPAHGRAVTLFAAGGADVVCDRVEFENARPQPMAAAPNANAVLVRGDGAGDPTTLTLRSCLIHDYAKSGIVASYDAFVAADDCCIDGMGHTGVGLVAQNGIQAGSGARLSLRRIVVTDHWHDPTAVSANGIYLFDCGDVAIADCNLGNCETGISILRSAPTSAPTLLRRNHVHGADFGILVVNAIGVVAQDNVLHAARSGVRSEVIDNGGGNLWSGNFYSSATAAAPLPLGGSAGAVDFLAQPLLRGFHAPQAVPMPNNAPPVDVLALDLDGDGDKDFAALTQSSVNGASICIGRNIGGIYSVVSLPFGSPESRPVALVDGEFNGQPGRDLAAVVARIAPNVTENKVYVFANDGNGVFSIRSVAQLPGVVEPTSITAGDFDGGGDDLVVTDAGASLLQPGSVLLLHNDGSGIFQPAALPLALTGPARDAVLADFDGDGLLDLAVGEGNPGPGLVHLLAGDAAGAFTPIAGSPITTSPNLQSLCATNLDGDLDVDLAVACARDAFGASPGAVDVLENLGAAQFRRTEHRVDLLPKGIASGRLDGAPYVGPDRRDLAIVGLGAGTVSTLSGYVRDCGFAQGGVAARGAVSVALADMDNDGRDDLVVADAAARSVVIRPRRLLARADAYGAGSEGRSGRIPVLRPAGATPLPTVPSASFGIELVNARPNTIAVLAIGLSTTPNLIADLFVTWVNFTGGEGRTQALFSIPADPYLLGLQLYAQAGVFDEDAQQGLFSGIALTQGLRLLFGE